MDCCGEYRAHGGPGQYGAGAAGPVGPAAWDYGPYAPLPYAPYAHYYPPPHDPYRYYRYDYPHHMHHNDHAMPMDYGAYASKEARVRRVVARRDARALTPSHHLPHAHTPPLECGLNGRGPTYFEPQMWPQYQMGLGGGWGGAGASVGAAWPGRGSCAREHMRYPTECRPVKGPHQHAQSQVCLPEGRSTAYPVYEEPPFSGESGARHRNTPEFPPGPPAAEPPRGARERYCPEPRRSPPQEKRPPVVPLPAFQQAFGSTEIGKFAEAFSRTEVALDDDNFAFESFPDWEGPEPQWSSQPASKEIKCEDF